MYANLEHSKGYANKKKEGGSVMKRLVVVIIAVASYAVIRQKT